MAKKKKSTDVNVTAFEILQEITRDENKPRQSASVKKATEQKNPAAVALGGRARDVALSKKRKSEIAKQAATARWKKK